MSEQEICPVCGAGTLRERKGDRILSYKGRDIPIADYYSVCDGCGLETATSFDMRMNKREVIRARKEVDGVPSGLMIRSMRDRYGLTQQMAGLLFGGGPVAFSKYENDDLLPTLTMTKLLRLAIEHEEVVPWLAKQDGLKLPEQRSVGSFMVGCFPKVVSSTETTSSLGYSQDEERRAA